MKAQDFKLTRYDADEGMVFDWVVDRFIDEVDENGEPTGNKIQEHLYAKTLFIGGNDSIYNYVEVYAPVEE